MPSRIVVAQRRAIVAAFAIGLVIGHAETAAAQNRGEPTTKFLELGVHYAAPERLSGSITGVFYYGDPEPNGVVPKNILTIRAAAGLGGFSVGIGHRVPRYGPFGPEALMTVTRTFS